LAGRSGEGDHLAQRWLGDLQAQAHAIHRRLDVGHAGLTGRRIHTVVVREDGRQVRVLVADHLDLLGKIDRLGVSPHVQDGQIGLVHGGPHALLRHGRAAA